MEGPNTNQNEEKEIIVTEKGDVIGEAAERNEKLFREIHEEALEKLKEDPNFESPSER